MGGGGVGAKLGGLGAKSARWVAKLVARPLASAELLSLNSLPDIP